MAYPQFVNIGKERVRLDIEDVEPGRYVFPVLANTTVVIGNEEQHFASEGWYTVIVESPPFKILGA